MEEKPEQPPKQDERPNRISQLWGRLQETQFYQTFKKQLIETIVKILVGLIIVLILASIMLLIAPLHSRIAILQAIAEQKQQTAVVQLLPQLFPTFTPTATFTPSPTPTPTSTDIPTITLTSTPTTIPSVAALGLDFSGCGNNFSDNFYTALNIALIPIHITVNRSNSQATTSQVAQSLSASFQPNTYIWGMCDSNTNWITY